VVIVFGLAILGLIANFHSYHPVWKIVLPFLLAIFFPIVLFRLLCIFHDIKLVFFPPKSIFVDGNIEVWKLVHSLEISLRRSGWTVVDNEDDSDFRVTIGITTEKHSIMCQIEDAQGRKETVILSDIFWPGEATAIIQEFAGDTQR